MLKKNLDNTYLVNDTIYSKGASHEGYSFVKYFLKKKNNINSFLDIGCGNGILQKLISKNTNYLGVDANVGIYKKKKSKKVKYFKDAQKTEEYLNNLKAKYDCVALMDVLEHTDSFFKLFKIALYKSSKYVVVGLPNEDYLIARLRFLFGKGILTHGLEMINTKPGHKHQWFIQYKVALPLIENFANKNKFKLSEKLFYINQPSNFFKRIIYKLAIFFIPKTIMMNNFCLIFKKN
jgi:2-polyprenyl-3-methyl-5-hydroxy-6-metoxy-1,4-benzoquinol methylase